jgi:hypothetical protein
MPIKQPIPDVRRVESDVNISRYSRKQFEKRTRKRMMLWQNGAACSLCGRPIYLESLSKNPSERDIEETWCVHFACRQKALNKLDRDSGMADFRK